MSLRYRVGIVNDGSRRYHPTFRLDHALTFRHHHNPITLGRHVDVALRDVPWADSYDVFGLPFASEFLNFPKVTTPIPIGTHWLSMSHGFLLAG